MVIHVDGTTPPHMLALPEYLKAHVYMPPNLVDEFTDSHSTIASIVQSFIETLGVPTVMHWQQAAVNNNWSLTQTGNLPVPSINDLPVIPNPTTPSSLYYIFPGRPYGSLQMVSQLNNSSHSSPERQAATPLVDAEPDWFAIMEQNEQILGELSEAHAKVMEQETTIERLREEIRALLVRPERRMVDEAVQSGGLVMHGGGLSGQTRPRLQTSGSARTAPPITYSQSFPASSATAPYHRSLSTSPVREQLSRHMLYPSLPVASPTPRLPRLQSHQVRFTGMQGGASSSRTTGGLQSFGVMSETFIKQHNLSDRLH